MHHLHSMTPKHRRPQRVVWLLVMAIGPGVLGLAADNDAGGMLAYVVTGADHHLLWFLAALAALAPVTFLVQELALRVAWATHLPYGQVIRLALGPVWSRVNGLVLHALNLVILVTEFVGMAMGEAMVGIPWKWGVGLALGLVLLVTSWARYQSVERLLLAIAAFNLVFIPAALLVHPSAQAWHQALSGAPNAALAFLLLSLAGNALAPWMIYWQQNAVWAGRVRSLKAGRWDIVLGVVSQGLMAAVVITLGAVTPHPAAALTNPLQWLTEADGRLVGLLFGLGIFNAGFLAASTISLASAWMVRESWIPGVHRRHSTPTRGSLFLLHLTTLGIAAVVAATVIVPAGTLALWAQALGALWMPVSLITLGLIARNRRLMGPMAIRGKRQAALAVITLLFLLLAVLAIQGL
ncbi:MAG: divalent metal cation transporter [Firmicutes bacterium]|nr:divalent metal cation transporter [Bacillota bacterium]